MFKVFDRNAERVMTYYNTVAVPSGVTVTNYDALVSDMAAKKAIVSQELADAKADAGVFSCATGDPNALLRQYITNMQSVKSALKNFRSSINNLIVAVRSSSSTST